MNQDPTEPRSPILHPHRTLTSGIALVVASLLLIVMMMLEERADGNGPVPLDWLQQPTVVVCVILMGFFGLSLRDILREGLSGRLDLTEARDHRSSARRVRSALSGLVISILVAALICYVLPHDPTYSDPGLYTWRFLAKALVGVAAAIVAVRSGTWLVVLGRE